MAKTASTAALAAVLFSSATFAATVEVETIPVRPDDTSQSAPIPDDALTLPGSSGDVPAANVEPPSANDSEALPQIYYSTEGLPKPVARMHAQLMEAALAGNLDRIRMILESNEMPPTLSFGDIDDPIDFLKESSGDGEGYEVLAILADILDAGFLHVDVGTPQEMYVWPYFARYPLHDLTPDQKVELFRIVTAGDFQAMEEYGAWNFYRAGIGPDGTLHYFVAGD